jgi:CheY-like chemotaxis protein
MLADFGRAPVKRLLLVEDDERRSRDILALIGNGDVHAEVVRSAPAALDRMKAERFHCAILDAGLPGVRNLLGQLGDAPRRNQVPLLIYAGARLERDDERNLRQLTRQSMAKLVLSPEHLYDEAGLYLHRDTEHLPHDKRDLVLNARKVDPVLAGRRVLVVDDDVRNLFSITSVLERYKMKVLNADNGRKGIETLEQTPDIDVVLMDVMMPEMNGYEAMQAIRKLDAFRNLPIIALTAKAMKGDREKCLAAGASDYVPKPVDVEQLLAVMRVWLS